MCIVKTNIIECAAIDVTLTKDEINWYAQTYRHSILHVGFCYEEMTIRPNFPPNLANYHCRGNVGGFGFSFLLV